MQVSVKFLATGTDHDINTEADHTVLQLKELLRLKVPFLNRYQQSIPTEFLKLSLDGNPTQEMEDDRPLSSYLKQEMPSLLLTFERPVRKIHCPKCARPFSHSEDSAGGIPQLLNCGHSVCFDCLGRHLAEETENDVGMKERGLETNTRTFACPIESCGASTYWCKGQALQRHDGIHRLLHLAKREKLEAEKRRILCNICQAEALFSCSGCVNMNYCFNHYNHVHAHEDVSIHSPKCIWSSENEPLIPDIFNTRYCCYCGSGESASCGGSCNNNHCEHKDNGLALARSVAPCDIAARLNILEGLQFECRKQLVAWNTGMKQLLDRRVDGREAIRQYFNNLIERIEMQRETMVSRLNEYYRDEELKLMEKMDTLGQLSGQVEPGLLYYQQRVAALQARDAAAAAEPVETPNGATCVVREVVGIDEIRARVSSFLSSQSSSDQSSEIAIRFSDTLHLEEICQVARIVNQDLPPGRLQGRDDAKIDSLGPDPPPQNPDLTAEENEESLIKAAKEGRIDEIKKLTAIGININCKANDDDTPLHWSCSNGHLGVVQYLIQSGANIRCKTKKGLTPLHFSVYYGHVEVVEYLFQEDPALKNDIKDLVIGSHLREEVRTTLRKLLNPTLVSTILQNIFC